MDLSKKIGQRIIELRKSKGLSQEQLAALAEVHEDYIGKIERGERTPSIKKIFTLTVALEITLEEFFKPFNQ
ncbi:helix-turn-helix transcriptional regulator [Marivirga atlantica]|uniref:Helix-turn-helix transcriptional regulator n=1 Tax=Marivirga atlantica TaxID=1548457 RepID=A0A937A5B6_9BACT|nr:helix-turn-helix transcriptional regulator [Marivirga atlantica]MBL0763912.1 helix-turn-helix transcriptional regulator [Marivirga atlantica]